jgi:hypothetical protein
MPRILDRRKIFTQPGVTGLVTTQSDMTSAAVLHTKNPTVAGGA